MTEPQNKGVRAGLAALLLIALVLRLPNLNQSIWFDEACMSTQRIGSLAQLLTTIHIDIHPPLYLVFAHLWNSVFGDSELSLRIPSLLAGLASLPLAFLIARRLCGNLTAWLTVLLLAFSPVHIWYSIEGRLYAPMLFAALAAVELFHRILEGRATRGTYWLYGILTAGMLALHYYLAVYVLLFALAALIAPRMKWAKSIPRAVLMINGVGLVLIAAWVGMKAVLVGFETSQGYLRAFTPIEVYRFLFQWCWTGNTLPAGLDAATGNPRWLLWSLAQLIGVALFFLGLRELWRRRDKQPAILLLPLYFICLPTFLLVLPLIGMGSTYIERSLLPALPFFLMIICLGLVSIRRLALRNATFLCVALLGLANLSAYYAHGDMWTVYKPHQDWRAAATYFGQEIDEGGTQRPIYTNMPNSRSLPYYDMRIQDASNLEPSTGAIQQAVSAFERLLGKDLGRRAGKIAAGIAQKFEEGKAQLADEAEMFIYPIGNGNLQAMKAGLREGYKILYLMDNTWHHRRSPGHLEELLRNPRLQLIEMNDFNGLVVYKVRLKARG
ncbi:MAG: 4-amino-4-deoxy-L-arabinose transferase-like glycosyltransferase [Planctomycetota bacterium]|jgi:4-amino-4-deoxy-L-arabinose transferase-like glycosyltransferase